MKLRKFEANMWRAKINTNWIRKFQIDIRPTNTTGEIQFWNNKNSVQLKSQNKKNMSNRNARTRIIGTDRIVGTREI